MNTIAASPSMFKVSKATRAKAPSSLSFAPSLKRGVRAVRPVQQRAIALRVRAETKESETEQLSATPETVTAAPAPAVVVAAENMGYDTSGGLFGFTPFGELWTGRLAMAGFTVGLVTEASTGQGILQQIGLNDGYENPALFQLLVLLMGGATLIATTKTCYDISTGNMPRDQVMRYAKGFGLTKDQVASLNSSAEELKADSEPWDSEVLACDINETVVERTTGGSAVPGYGEHVEITNGRWAMIGFATAILIEAASGNGIIPQLIGYGKASGLLGAESGF